MTRSPGCWAAKLGVITALIRRRARPGHPPRKPGGLPGAWQEGLTQEVSNALGVSMRAAGALIELAAILDERLVLTREALAGGVISLAKAKIIAEATAVLDDARAAAAETLIAGQLAGKTPGQVAALIARAVVTVDPEGSRKRRERAQREDARVRFWREHAGTAALAAFGLPPDEALAANQHIQDRALAYRAAGMAGTLDQLRVRAFLDALTGAPAVHPAHLRPRRPALRFRTCGAAPQGRQDMRLQRRLPLPPRPQSKAIPRLDRDSAEAGLPPVDHPVGPHLHHRTDEIPHLMAHIFTTLTTAFSR